MSKAAQENLTNFWNDNLLVDDEDDDIDKIKWVTAFHRVQINMGKKDIIRIFDHIDEEQSGYIDRFDFMGFCKTREFERDHLHMQQLQQILIARIEQFQRFQQIGNDPSIEIVYSRYTVNPCRPIDNNATAAASDHRVSRASSRKKHSSLNFSLSPPQSTHDPYYGHYYDDDLLHELDAEQMWLANRDAQHCLCCSKCGRQFYAFGAWKKHERKCRFEAEKYIAYLLSATAEDNNISFLDDEHDSNNQTHVQPSSTAYDYDIPPPPTAPPPASPTPSPQHIAVPPPPPPIEDGSIIRYNANELSDVLSAIPTKVAIWSRLFLSTSNECISQRIQSLQQPQQQYVKCMQTSAYQEYRDVMQTMMVHVLLSSTPPHVPAIQAIDTSTNAAEAETAPPPETLKMISIHVETPSQRILDIHDLPQNIAPPFQLQESTTDLVENGGGDNRMPQAEESDVDDYDVRVVSDTMDAYDTLTDHQTTQNKRVSVQPASDNEADTHQKRSKQKQQSQSPEKMHFAGINALRSQSSFNLTMVHETETLPLPAAVVPVVKPDVIAMTPSVDTEDSMASSSLSASGVDDKLSAVKQALDVLSPRLMAAAAPAADAFVESKMDSMEEQTKAVAFEAAKTVSSQEEDDDDDGKEVSSLSSVTADEDAPKDAEDEKRQHYKVRHAQNRSNKFRQDDLEVKQQQQQQQPQQDNSKLSTNPLAQRRSGYFASADYGSMDISEVVKTSAAKNSHMSMNPLSPQVDSPMTPLDVQMQGTLFDFQTLVNVKNETNNAVSAETENIKDVDADDYDSEANDFIIDLILDFADVKDAVYLDGYLMLHEMVYDLYRNQYNAVWHRYRLPLWLQLLFDQQRMRELETYYTQNQQSNNCEHGKLRWVYNVHDMLYYEQALFTHLMHAYGIPPPLQSLLWFHLSHNALQSTDLETCANPLTWQPSDLPALDGAVDQMLNANFSNDSVQRMLMKSYVFQPSVHHRLQSFEARQIMNAKNKHKLLPNIYFATDRRLFCEHILQILLQNVWSVLPLQCQGIVYKFWMALEQQHSMRWLAGDIGNIHTLLVHSNDCEFLMSVYLWDGYLGIALLVTSAILIAIHSKKNMCQLYNEPLLKTEIAKLRKVYRFVYEYVVNDSDYDRACLSLNVIYKLCHLPVAS